MNRAAFMVLAIALTIAPLASATAQDDEEAAEEQAGGDSEAPPEEASEAGDEALETGDSAEAVAPDAASASDLRKWYFGLYSRYVFVPAFVLELFLAEAPTVGNFAWGAAVNLYDHEGGPSIQMGIGYASFAFEDPFRANGDPPEDTEWVESDLGFVHLTGSMLWNTVIVPNKLAFEYGFGIDFGIVTGELVRTEAYQRGGVWAPCQSPGNPADFAPSGAPYCEPPTNLLAGTDPYDKEGAHYHVVQESVPAVFALPILPHLALRYEPIPGLALKFETAFIPLVWFGISAAYGPF